MFVNDIPEIFRMARCLLFADDLKLFAKICSIRDAMEFQADIDALQLWCERNILYLIVDKCFSATYCRGLRPILCDYGGSVLLRKSEVRDLGPTFDTKLTFNF